MYLTKGEVMNEIKRTERGWPGHFIMGHRCSFRRNTLLENDDTKIIVSTVGAMPLNQNHDAEALGFKESDSGFETIGYKRYYETMAFHAIQEGPYLEADVGREVSFESPWSIDYISNSADNDANDMHEAAVSEIIERMQKGEIKNATDPSSQSASTKTQD